MQSSSRKSLLSVLIILTIGMVCTGCEPKDRRPGTWLSGEEVRNNLNDWSFVNEPEEIFIETHPWYGVPFSVTTVVAGANGKVFVPSIYESPAEFPGSKYWNSIIRDNPEVRVKIGDRIYLMNALPAADEAEFAEGLAALAAKYDFWRSVQAGEQDTAFTIIRLHPRS